MNLFIGCTSKKNIEDIYIKDSVKLIQQLARLDHVDLVYGTWNEGLLSVLYQEFTKYNKKIIGFLTSYHKRMLGSEVLSDVEIITDTTIDRFAQIYEHSDILLFLPGGLGTYAEIFSALEECRIGRGKKMILYNLNSFYDSILEEFKHLREKGFVEEELSDYMIVENNIDKIVEIIKEEIK